MDHMGKDDAVNARGLTDINLLKVLSGYKPGTYPHHLFAAELKRRENRTARLALTLSFVSLVVSVVGLWLKR